jgi:hypothetical protein
MVDQLLTFKSLFKGREDVFSIRWEKDGKSGYFPAYDMNQKEYSQHKAKGGTLDNFSSKKLQPLTDGQLLRHLTGNVIIGIYPLLVDNTSWFIAADFSSLSYTLMNYFLVSI